MSFFRELSPPGGKAAKGKALSTKSDWWFDAGDSGKGGKKGGSPPDGKAGKGKDFGTESDWWLGAGDSGKGGKKNNSKGPDTARSATKGKGHHHGIDINAWDKGGMNNKGRVPRAGSSDTLQQELFSAAGDEGTLKALVNQIYESRSPLNVINISTILHRMARKRIVLPAGVTDFLASRLEGLDR